MEEKLKKNLPWLKGLAHRYFKNDADAEDLTSETVLRLWQAKDRFDESRNFRSLAFKVMQNLYINKYNRRKCAMFVEPFSTSEPSTCGSADSLVMSHQIVEAVRKASQRSICIHPVVMYAYGFSYQEIADLANVPMGTVQRRIHDGRENLKKLLTA